MTCPYFQEAKRNLCGAVDGLLHPSIFEERTFCRGDNYRQCGIYRSLHGTNAKVTTDYYIEKIQDQQFQETGCLI